MNDVIAHLLSRKMVLVQKRNITADLCDLTTQTELVLAKITKRDVLKRREEMDCILSKTGKKKYAQKVTL